jgi:hypothetical protein
LPVAEQPEYDDCLWEFIRLIPAPTQHFLSYAAKWRSLLGLCAHHGEAAGHALGYPSTLTGVLEFEDSDRPITKAAPACPLAGREYLSDWRKWAREAWVLLVVAAHVRKGTRPDVDTWLTAAGVEQQMRERWAERFARSEGEEALRLRVSAWAQAAGVHPIAIARTATQSDMALASPHLLGIIGAQLVDQITAGDGPYLCSMCGWPGRSVGRRPRADKGYFCSEVCRRHAKVEVIKRSQRARRVRLQQGQKPHPTPTISRKGVPTGG